MELTTKRLILRKWQNQMLKSLRIRKKGGLAPLPVGWIHTRVRQQRGNVLSADETYA